MSTYSVNMPDLADNTNVGLTYRLKVTYVNPTSGLVVAINYPCNAAPPQPAPPPSGTLYFDLECIADTTAVVIAAVLKDSGGTQTYAEAVRVGINFIE